MYRILLVDRDMEVGGDNSLGKGALSGESGNKCSHSSDSHDRGIRGQCGSCGTYLNANCESWNVNFTRELVMRVDTNNNNKPFIRVAGRYILRQTPGSGESSH